jgi:hypothetical protein
VSCPGILHNVELQAARLVGQAALGLRGHLLLELGLLAGLGGQIGDDGAHYVSSVAYSCRITLA